MITTAKLTELDQFVVERLDANGVSWSPITKPVADYDLARQWADNPDRRVVLIRTTRYVCEDS
jgi:hypothetical protein